MHHFHCFNDIHFLNTVTLNTTKANEEEERLPPPLTPHAITDPVPNLKAMTDPIPNPKTIIDPIPDPGAIIDSSPQPKGYD